MPGDERRTEMVEKESADLISEQVERLKELFPEVVSEGKVDFERLKRTLGEIVDDGPERYSFTWAGKRDAIRLLQVPSRATLKPAQEESIDWETTGNVFIEGENLEVLKLLYKAYAGRVKMIYIDPPYNTGNDFIYPDNFADPLETYLKLTGQQDSEGNLLTSNPETSGRYHSAWLSMMYPRLFVARQLLREDGVIFVSIDDHEVQNLRLLLNEVFGEENLVACVIWQKVFSPKNTAMYFSEDHDYLLVYARNKVMWRPALLPRTDDSINRYTNPDNDPRGPWLSGALQARNYYSKGNYEVESPTGKVFRNPKGTYWRFSKGQFHALDADNRIWWGHKGDNVPRLKRFLSEVRQGIIPQTLWTYSEVGHTQEAKEELLKYVDFEHSENVLNSVKPSRLIRRAIQIGTATHTEDIVLDFFSGSAPTAHAVLTQNRADGGNRHYCLVQIPEPLARKENSVSTVADLGKSRIQNATTQLKQESRDEDLFANGEKPEDLGFRVFKLDESNYRQWRGVEERDAGKYAEEMELFTDPLVPGWEPEDVVWEVALKEGYSLSSRVEHLGDLPKASDAKPSSSRQPYRRARNLFSLLFRVTEEDKGQSFLIALDDDLTQEMITSLELGKDDLFICRDAALTDEQAANVALQCRLKTI